MSPSSSRTDSTSRTSRSKLLEYAINELSLTKQQLFKQVLVNPATDLFQGSLLRITIAGAIATHHPSSVLSHRLQ